MLRRFIKKGKAISDYDVHYISQIEHLCNSLPRKILNYNTPDKLFEQELNLIYVIFSLKCLSKVLLKTFSNNWFILNLKNSSIWYCNLSIDNKYKIEPIYSNIDDYIDKKFQIINNYSSQIHIKNKRDLEKNKKFFWGCFNGGAYHNTIIDKKMKYSEKIWEIKYGGKYEDIIKK